MRTPKLASLALGLLFTMGAGAQGVVASAHGGYQQAGQGGALRTIEFTATRDSRNIQRGQGHLFNHVTGTRFHLIIDCLNVSGNIATISGTVDKTTISDLQGDPFFLRVVDNGEGKNSAPDQASGLFIAPSGVGPTCTDSFFTPALVPIQGGNIQVK